MITKDIIIGTLIFFWVVSAIVMIIKDNQELEQMRKDFKNFKHKIEYPFSPVFMHIPGNKDIDRDGLIEVIPQFYCKDINKEDK